MRPVKVTRTGRRINLAKSLRKFPPKSESRRRQSWRLQWHLLFVLFNSVYPNSLFCNLKKSSPPPKTFMSESDIESGEESGKEWVRKKSDKSSSSADSEEGEPEQECLEEPSQVRLPKSRRETSKLSLGRHLGTYVSIDHLHESRYFIISLHSVFTQWPR